MKVCIAFFGIMRSLCHTKDSILKNVISPLSAFFDLELVAHFYEDAFHETAECGLSENEIKIRSKAAIYILSNLGKCHG